MLRIYKYYIITYFFIIRIFIVIITLPLPFFSQCQRNTISRSRLSINFLFSCFDLHPRFFVPCHFLATAILTSISFCIYVFSPKQFHTRYYNMQIMHFSRGSRRFLRVSPILLSRDFRPARDQSPEKKRVIDINY